MKKILCRQLCSESQWNNFLCCMRPLVTLKTRFLTRECFHSALGKEHGHPYRSTRVSRSEIILMGRMLLKGKLFKWTIALPLIASCWIMNYSGALVFQNCWNKWPQVGLITESILRLVEALWVWNPRVSEASLKALQECSLLPVVSGGSWPPSACKCVTPASASTFTWTQHPPHRCPTVSLLRSP